MDATNDLALYRLQKRISELEAENNRYKRNASLARKYEFRITGAVLLAIGAVITLVAYPSYNLSPNANVLMMVGIGALFVGAVTMFLNTERFINQKVAEGLNLSSIVVVDDLLRDLRVKNKGVYLPAEHTGSRLKVFIPLQQRYEIPAQDHLSGDRAFLIDLANPAHEGVLLTPLGYHLYRYTTDDLKVGWRAERAEEDASEVARDDVDTRGPPLADKLQEVLAKGLEIADTVVTSLNGGTLNVRLRNTAYLVMCRSMAEEAPQVCEQIGCPLCSLIACIYAEHTDRDVVIDSAKSDGNDIVVSCKVV